MKHIDANTALELLKAAVEEYGEDHKVEHCKYVANEKPYCIVGVALAHNGATLDEIEGPDGEFSNGATISNRRDLFDSIDEDARVIFNAAQTSQDMENTWLAALDEAVSTAKMIEERGLEFAKELQPI